MDNETNYCLLLADLAASTDLHPEVAHQALGILSTTIDDVNQTYRPALVSPLEVNYGDEFAGLFVGPGHIYEIVDLIRHNLREVAQFRFVVCVGRIGYAGGSIRQMGGPVFKDASDSLDRLKKTGRLANWRIGDVLANATLDALTNTSHAMIEAMTDYQYDVYRLLRAGVAQTEIAKTLGKYEQSVSKAVQRSHADLVIDTENALIHRLNEHQRQMAGLASSL
ncbi:MAG: SatD family protein [Pseudomonadota bacterium]